MTERKFTPPTSFPAEYVNGYGARVTLLAKGTGPFPYCGQLENGIWAFFTEDGFADDWSSYPTHDLHDIPKTTVQWANDMMYRLDGDSREEADANAMWDCIAVIRREWTEGQPPEYFTEEARMSNDLVKRLRERAKIASEEGNMTAKCDANYFEKSADRIEELEAKLAKAVEALVIIADTPSEMTWGVDSEVREAMNGMEIIAETTLAELTGGKDE